MSFVDFCKAKLADRNKANEDEQQRLDARLGILVSALSCVEDIGLKVVAGVSYWHCLIYTPKIDWRARIEQGVLDEGVSPPKWTETSLGDQYRVKLSNSLTPGYEFDSYVTRDREALNNWVRNKLADYAIEAGLVE